MSHRPATAVLGLSTAALGIPTAVRLVGDHGTRRLSVLDTCRGLTTVPYSDVR